MDVENFVNLFITEFSAFFMVELEVERRYNFGRLYKEGRARMTEKMEYIKATEKDIDIIFDIVQNTVLTIYPKYYPKEVVDFFCQHHSRENISRDIDVGNIRILLVDNQIVGTGSHEKNHITRVYVLPEFQGKGYGSFIMQCLEEEIFAKYSTILLDASLPASHLYEQRGYCAVKHEKLFVENGAVLVYEVMEKT